MLKDGSSRSSFDELKDFELRSSTDEERKIVQRKRRGVKCAHAILVLGKKAPPPHNYSPPQIMKLDQFVRSARDYDSIF